MIVGEYDQAVNNEEYLPRRVVGVSMVLPHPYHDPYTMQHDIALIRLDQVLSLFIYSPACLSAPGIDTAGDAAWVYGKHHPPITLFCPFLYHFFRAPTQPKQPKLGLTQNSLAYTH